MGGQGNLSYLSLRAGIVLVVKNYLRQTSDEREAETNNDFPKYLPWMDAQD